MPKIFYIADTHFGEDNIRVYDGRPFKDVKTMDTVMKNNWNNVVSSNDTVFIIGDVGASMLSTFKMDNDNAYFTSNELNGHIYVVQGNHDVYDDIYKSMETCMIFAEVGDKEIVLSHQPQLMWKNDYKGAIHLYGHVHSSYDYNIYLNAIQYRRDLYLKPFECYNVGAMMPWMNYTPRTLDEIVSNAVKQTKSR